MSIQYTNENVNNEIEIFSDFIEKVFQELMKCGKEFVKEQLETLDKNLMLSRDTKRYRSKGIRKTAVKTKLGTVEYEHRIYFDTTEKKHVFLLDEKIRTHSVGLYDEEICKSIEKMICNQSFRETSESISKTTGLDISHQEVWNIVQKSGQRLIDNYAEPTVSGSVESKILYEESDGAWLKLQGKDREKYGSSKEMKIGIAYDGVIHHETKSGKIRKELDNKVAYASFETASEFRKHKEAVIASNYNTDEIELRVKNGDGAQWIQKDPDCECICVLDEYHRNKKITECVSDKKIAEQLRKLLFSGEYQTLLDTIEAYINSSENKAQKKKFEELYKYYYENFDALSDYFSRGIKIPETREPGVIHHADLGSMESNVFTLIGNRMKDRRACWSVSGSNRLAALLCKFYSVSNDSNTDRSVSYEIANEPLSASKAPKTDGHGYEFPRNVSIPINAAWVKQLSALKPLSDLFY